MTADSGGTGGGRVAVGLATVTLVAGPIAALPPQEGDTVMVLFREEIGAPQAFAAAAAIDARVVWADLSGELMAIVPGRASPWRLLGHGALMVGTTPALAGCFSFTRT